MKRNTRNKRDREQTLAARAGGPDRRAPAHRPDFKMAMSRVMPGSWWEVLEWHPNLGERGCGGWRALLTHLDLEDALAALARMGAITPSPEAGNRQEEDGI